MPSDALRNDKMLDIRNTFTGLLSDFIEGRNVHWVEAFRFKNLLLHANLVMVTACRYYETVSRASPAASGVSRALDCARVDEIPAISSSSVICFH